MRGPNLGGLALLLGVASCDQLFGIDPAQTGWTGTSSGTGGTGATVSASGGQPGTGGQPPSFAFAITDPTVSVPYGGLNYVHLEITPSDGFAGPVAVSPDGAPTGLVVMPLTIPAGSTSGMLEIGAGSTLTLGTMFHLMLAATSGAITQTAMASAVVTGKPGDFDTGFGSAGIVMGPTSANGGWVNLNDIREVGGNIVVGGLSAGDGGAGGDAIGLRYLPTGMPDLTFNGTGMVTSSYCACTPLEGGTVSVANEPSGTLLFTGWGQSSLAAMQDIFLFRYNSDGTMNVSGSDTGTEDVSLDGNTVVTAAVIVPESANVVVAGAKDGQLFVSRIADEHSFGAPDDTFAAPNGWIAPVFGGSPSSAGALTLDAMGRVVVAGWVTTTTMGDDAVLLRLTADGALDPSFGSGGTVPLARAGDQHGSAVLVQPDGNIVVAADTNEGGAMHLLVQRFLPSGAADTTFGSMGVVLAPLDDAPQTLSASPSAWMAQMLDGRLVVAGNGALGTTSGPVFARFLPDGTPDPTFGTAGEVVAYLGMNAAMQAMTLASDGKLLIAGTIPTNPGGSFVARLWN